MPPQINIVLQRKRKSLDNKLKMKCFILICYYLINISGLNNETRSNAQFANEVKADLGFVISRHKT